MEQWLRSKGSAPALRDLRGLSKDDLWLLFDVTALPENDEWIKLEDVVLVHIRDVRPLPSEPATLTSFEIGGGGLYADKLSYFYWNGELNPGDTFQTPDFPSFDFYTMQPGELGTFALEFSVGGTLPGLYSMQIGVRYSYKGLEYVVFSSPLPDIAILSSPPVWWKCGGLEGEDIRCQE
jgi:hypothetical protein